MPPRSLTSQIAFRYRAADSATGATRETVKRLAEYLGVDENQVGHHALRELACGCWPSMKPTMVLWVRRKFGRSRSGHRTEKRGRCGRA